MADLEFGSVLHTVLLFTVSEPGEWTVASIAEDLPELGVDPIQHAAERLFEAGLIHINSYDHRLWPLRAGKDLLSAAS